MDRTLSDLLPEPVKNRRAIISTKAIDPAHFPGAIQWMFDNVFSEDQCGPLLTAAIWHIVKRWGNSRPKNCFACQSHGFQRCRKSATEQ